MLLLAAAGCALALANSPWANGYRAARELLGATVNDGLMTLFFLVVGLELRRELREGSLAAPGAATLPAIAALGGVIFPAAIFLAFNREGPARLGYAIPAATDIAFAIGVLALLGARISRAVRVLLLAIALADDLVAILLIVLVYSRDLRLPGLMLALGGLAGLLALRAAGWRRAVWYLLPALALWSGLWIAHIQPSISGALLGFLVPVRGLESRLSPWVVFGVLPLFALVNAGVDFGAVDLRDMAVAAVMLGVVLGLVMGKPLGILLAASIAVRLRVARLPEGIDGYRLALVGLLAGIGFTMSTLMATLAFPDPRLLDAAKLGILVAGTIASVAGLAFGRRL